jgi:hypothetical protein
MANIIPFESKQLPSFLANAGKPVNDDLSTGIGGGFKSLSIKGKVFAIVAGKERTTIMNPNDEDEAASSLEVVILKANKTLSKVWYSKEWNDGDEASKPDCFSNDGAAPDKDSTDPQAKSCATCKWNAFGSSKNGKGKACADSRRVAVAAPDHLNEPMMLRVPAASLKPLAEFGRTLSARGVPYSSVVTKLRFELDEATPKLIFKPVGFLSDAQYQEAQAMVESEVVGQIIGTVPFAAHADDEKFETKKAAPALAPKKEVEAPKPAPKPVVKKAAVVQEPVEEVEEEVQAPKVEVKKAVAAKAPSMVDDLDALLMELDG